MRVLVTGSNGLIGSEAVSYFSSIASEVIGVDNNMRAVFFGPEGDTRWNQRRLQRQARGYIHVELDIRDRGAVLDLLAQREPDLIVHCAAQPSHDLAARMPFEDFDTNAVGTLNLLEGLRRHRPKSVFVLMSTNKVYGDAPNELPLVEHETRWEYARAEDWHGIDESLLSRPLPPLALRRLEASRRRDGAGVRPLLRSEGGSLPGRMPDRAPAQRRGTAWLPLVSRQGGAVRHHLSDLRVQGQAGP